MTAGQSAANPPPEYVLRAFGRAGVVQPLLGGLSVAWRVGDVVLKRLDISGEELEWQAHIRPQLTDARFRVPWIVPTREGSLAVDGWYAQEWLPGEHRRDWAAILETSAALAERLSGLARPALLDARTDPWGVADRVVWEELPLTTLPGSSDLEDLAAGRRPVGLSDQLIHGDLSGNVLLAEGSVPGVIDISPYWRPGAYQSAIVIVDAILWMGADESILDLVRGLPQLGQLLLRALLFRIAASRLRGVAPTAAEVANIDRVARLAVSL